MLLLAASNSLYGQSFIQRKTVTLDFTPTQVSVDTKGALYLSDISGNIYKYGNDGTLVHHYSTKQLGTIHALEAMQGLRVFAFYQDLQEILMIDRFLANERKFSLSTLPFTRLATLAQDQSLWLLLERDLTLLKIRQSDNFRIIENQWANIYGNESLNITAIKEYKNRLYLYDQGKRMLIFDNLGNFITTIDAPKSVGYLLDEDRLYFVYPTYLEVYDIKLLSKQQVNLPQNIDKIQISGNSAYLILENVLTIYDYIP